MTILGRRAYMFREDMLSKAGTVVNSQLGFAGGD
jgi:hypothetical protein